MGSRRGEGKGVGGHFRQKDLHEQRPRAVTGLFARLEKAKAAKGGETRKGLGWALNDKPRNVGFISLLGSGYLVSLSPLLPWPLCVPEVIEKFDYVFAENGTVQYKHGRLLSKQVSAPQGLSPGHFSTEKQSTGDFCPGWGRAPCPPCPEPCDPCPDHPEPPRGGAAAGLDQLLPPLHGPAEAAQEAVRPRPALCPASPPSPGPGKGWVSLVGPGGWVLVSVKSRRGWIEFRAFLLLSGSPPSLPPPSPPVEPSSSSGMAC